ncbi:uncharacterized protein RHOBADRAFT_52808 [Rhodotorula graminis WP1]|uniref:Uncharacterized protein n=1 Tax=Rhodotorula graminis (strain WP1) TaxID=578459 RepID=A0A194S5J4_RHOGW|nr:uncharacterized protein RHOBADRAFT_52808 [Rhodotorula graminis WP1]KPV75780.1 hypothetical protein RHOBADRAFT_52808 [Rhodotorula graminis WP1]
MDDSLPYTEPFASTSRAVFTLPYKPFASPVSDDDAFADPAVLALYDQAWKTCNSKIQSVLSSLHDASLDQIVAYVRSRPSDAQSLYAALGGRAPVRSGLIIGASPGSSSLLYSSLTRQLTSPAPRPPPAADANDDPSPADHPRPCIVSRLASRDCSNIKKGWAPSTLKSAMIVPEDLQNLQAWYEHRFGKKDSEDAPTLVVLLEDLEAMDGKVLTQLIDALACYADLLPLTLLIGIATTADAFFSLVSRKTANQLDAARFFVDPGVSAFNALVRGLFVDWMPPLALAPRAYTELWRTFEDFHHSIDATISFIQYLYMAHFTAHPCATLTLEPTSSPSPPHALDPLPVPILAALRTLPSFQSAPPTSPIAAALLAHDPPLPLAAPTAAAAADAPPLTPSQAVSCARSGLRTWHAQRSLAFEALVATMEFWDKRKPLEGVLALVLGAADGDEGEGTGTGTRAGDLGRLVDRLGGLVLQASSTKLPHFLRSLSARLGAFVDSHPSLAAAAAAAVASPSSSSADPPSSSPLIDFLAAQLAALEPLLAAPRAPGKSTLFNTNLAGGMAAALGGMGAAGGGGGRGAGEADREFSRVARETAEGLKARLKTALRPPTDLVLHELWFTSDPSAMKRLYPTPFPSLVRQLTKLDPLADPAYAPPALDNADQRPVDEQPSDLGVAWRVYRDTHAQGRLVNLGEWWAGWEIGAAEEEEREGEGEGEGWGGRTAGSRGRKRARTGREEGGEGDEEGGGSEEDEGERASDDDEDEGGPERRKQARFLRAVGDLAHLGFIHPTTYKPEHVLKSVY